MESKKLAGKSAKNTVKIVKMWDIPFYGSKRSRVLKDLLSKKKGKSFWVVTVNPEFVMKSRKDGEFLKLLSKSDVNVVDGIGIIWAKKVLEKEGIRLGRAFRVGLEVLQGKYSEEVVAGSWLMGELCREAAKRGEKVFFLGGFGDRAKRSGENLEKKYAGLKFESCEGMPKVANSEVIKRINDFKPKYLFVAYGMKKQEEWIEKNKSKLEVGVVMGVGRSFDYYSGDLKLAPMAWRKMGLEWLYSLIKDPKRWKRQLALPKFIWMVLRSR